VLAAVSGTMGIYAKIHKSFKNHATRRELIMQRGAVLRRAASAAAKR
jgi:hypothetical protein